MATITQTTTLLEQQRAASPVLYLGLKAPNPKTERQIIDLATRVEALARGTDLGERVALWLKEQETRKPGESIVFDATELLVEILEPARRQDPQFTKDAFELHILLQEEIPSGVDVGTWIEQMTMRRASLQSKLQMSASARLAQSTEYRRRYAALAQATEARYNGLLDQAIQCEEARVKEEDAWQTQLEAVIAGVNGLLVEWNDLQPTVATLNHERQQGQQALRGLADKAERLL